ncbi:MAG: molybdopterin oxidoreductase family protein, partial [Nannocystaceae bacterium]
PDAMAVYLGNPNVHNFGSLLFGPPLLRSLRTHNRFSATSVDQLPHHVTARALFGHQLLIPIPDIDRTEFLLVFGANPVVSAGSLMSAPDVKRRLQDLRKRGGKLVVFDPRRTQTAALADEHFACLPGTDALILLALVHTIFSEGLVKLGRVARFVDGTQTLADVVQAFSPEQVAGHVGIEADRLRSLARDFASADAAVCYGRLGVSTQVHGTLCHWLIAVLNTLTGNLDRVGGAMFTTPAVDVLAQTSRGGSGRYTSRVRKLPEFAGELPVAALAEEILTPGPGAVRGLLTIAGNPVLSTPNGRQLNTALEKLDWMVSIDLYRNETTSHADLILPPTPPLEREHYDLVFHLLAIRNTARFSPPTLPRTPGARHEWEILHGLHQRIVAHTSKMRPGQRAKVALMGRMGPRRLLDFGLRRGPYGSGALGGPRLSLARLRNAPHGMDLGPLRPSLPARLKTRNGRIDLAPSAFVEGVAKLREQLQPPAASSESPDYDLLLIGRRHVRSNNSWLHNSVRLVKGKPRCTLLIHPEDAAARHLKNGDVARVRSRVGTVELPCEVTPTIRAGVISIPHGWGHTSGKIALRVAEDHAGVSVNDLTDEQNIDPLSGNAVLNGVPVAVSPLGGKT